MRRKGGGDTGEWYHSIANGIGLRRWAFFFCLNQLLPLILHISVSARYSKVYRSNKKNRQNSSELLLALCLLELLGFGTPLVHLSLACLEDIFLGLNVFFISSYVCMPIQ